MFCAAGLAALGLTACDAGVPRSVLGDLDGVSQGPTIDAGTTEPPADGSVAGPEDMAHAGTSPDLSTQGGATCAAGSYDSGLASALTVGQAKYVSSQDMFVCRDANGVFAMTSLCPHAQCTLTKKTSQYYCNCHGATFDLNGGSPTSPAHKALEHYAVCIDSAGHVQVDFNNIVAATTRA